MKRLLGVALFSLSVQSFAASWEYENKVDKMSGEDAKMAWVRSDNSLNLQFPYSGPNYGSLWIRRHPKYGTDVIVKIDKGQVLCRSYEPCSVMVKFDDAKPVRFTGTPSADHDSTMVFLDPVSKFIAQAKTAKKILVQFTVYQAGDQILEFSTPNTLNWSSPKK